MNPLKPLYYFILTYSYRSYLTLGRSVGEFWPRHDADIPIHVKSILDDLGREAAGDWGVYDDKKCVIVDKNDGAEGSLNITLTEPTYLTKSLEYFFNCICIF